MATDKDSKALNKLSKKNKGTKDKKGQDASSGVAVAALKGMPLTPA